MNTFRGITQYILDLVFPPQCVLCKRSGHVLCTFCQETLPPLTGVRCQRCHMRITMDGTCKQCQHRPLALSGLRSFSDYHGPLRTCIHALKYHGNIRLAEPLGHLLAKTYVAYRMHADIIIPVPLHLERQQQRGYNQSALLARACATEVKVPQREDIVIRQRATPAQVSLSMHQRQLNMRGAFRCTPAFTTGALRGRKILIVDDVCTTGATIEACATSLFAAGAYSVWGLVLARPDREGLYCF